MSNTKREPLLSDQSIRETFMYGSLILDAEHGFMSGANYARHEYEAARAMDAELIQMLVDDLRLLRIEFGNSVGQTTEIGIASLSAAEAAGFKPSYR
jgi:hypothetical protein